MTAIQTGADSRAWAVACRSCETESGGFGAFAVEEARQLADTHDALQHARQPTAAVLAAAEHVESPGSRSTSDVYDDEDGWF